MEQRIEFVMRAMSTDNFRELCAEYGISAKLGYNVFCADIYGKGVRPPRGLGRLQL